MDVVAREYVVSFALGTVDEFHSYFLEFQKVKMTTATTGGTTKKTGMNHSFYFDIK